MKRKMLWIIFSIATLILFAIIINWFYGTPDKTIEFVGLSYKLQLGKNEKIVKPDSSLLKLYNNNCLVENSETYLNKTITGPNYLSYISFSSNAPVYIAQQTINKFRVINKLGDKTSQKIIYKNSEMFIYRCILYGESVKNTVIYDVISKDSSVIDSIGKCKNFIINRLIHN